MAANEDDVQIEGTGGRRTRSGRKSSAIIPTPLTPSRSTRRATRKQAQEQIIEVFDEPVKSNDQEGYDPTQSDIIKEMLAEAAQGVIIQDNQNYEQNQNNELTEEIICEAYEEPQEYQYETVTILEDEIENDVYGEQIQAIQDDEQDEDVEMTAMQNIEQVDLNTIVSSEIQQIDHIVEDENGSSFPFGGSVQQSENSADNKVEENADLQTVEMADNSLLASMAGDNANSLPSAGEESLSKENFEVVKHKKQGNDSEISYNLDDTHSDHAIAEDLPNGSNGNETDCGLDKDKTLNDIDAEMVSDDDQKMISKSISSNVKDTEEVSDDELPAPKRAELPADTEVVSEDELPSNSSKKDVNKRKATADEEYNPSSPTGEDEEDESAPEKKVRLESEEKEDKKKEKKKLPDLEKYWKTVKDDVTDFTGWTYLLQYVDQETDVEAAREAYDAFLSHYPYCYGYWRKYADYEKRKGDKEKCYEVFERGLNAIPLSVDLWIHYLSHVKSNSGDNEEYIRSQFIRAIDACGLEFRSDKLWEAFIKWEMEGKRYTHIIKIYDQLLGVPTQGYNGHFDAFQDLVNNHPASITVGIDEFKKLRSEVRESSKEKNSETGDFIENDDGNEPDDHVRNDDEMIAIKDKIISIRRKLHKATIAAVTARWTFEEGIKRPYFHVKPLERSQLKNWKEYLDFEIEKGDRARILILFERCLIACALYDEFWVKLIRFLESQEDPKLIETIRHAYSRACTIHHPDKPSLHLLWSAFEECENNFDKASEILIKLDERCPNLLQVSYRRINLERRRCNYEKCKELYEYYISNAKSKNIAGSLAIKYARFCHKFLKDIELGMENLKKILEKDSGNTRVALQMIDLALQRDIVNESEIVEIMDKFVSRDGIDLEQKVLFAQRKVEFLEDFGSSAQGLQEAQRTLQNALNKANEAKKKSESSPSHKSSKETKTSSSSNYNNSNNYYSGTAGSQSSYYNNSGQQQQTYQQQSYDGYSYNHWQYGSGYSGYGQWSGYGNYY